MKADMWPTEPLHDDVDALHRDAAARRGVAVDDQQPAAAGGAGRLAGVAFAHARRPTSCSRRRRRRHCR